MYLYILLVHFQCGNSAFRPVRTNTIQIDNDNDRHVWPFWFYAFAKISLKTIISLAFQLEHSKK